MARDTQIVSSADHAAPKDYTLPGNAEVVLRAVQATFTDNGASGDWLPCLTLISDSGHTIARALDPNVRVTAGDDAEVSWFPGVKPSASAGGGAALPFITGYATGIGPVSSGGFATDFITNGTWTSSDTAIFNPGSSQQFFVVAPGSYLYTLSQVYLPVSAPTAGTHSTAFGLTGPHGFEFHSVQPFIRDTEIDAVWRSTHSMTVGHNLTNADLPDGFAIGLSHNAGVDCLVDWQFMVVQLNPTPTATPV